MELDTAVQLRRSIRKFQDRPVPRGDLEAILEAGRRAPSAKNRQPWHFTVVQGAARGEMLAALDAGLARERVHPLLPGRAHLLPGAEHTRTILAQAPAIILVANPQGLPLERPLAPWERVFELCDAQSVGACMENMSLTALGLGLGSLWVGNTYFAQPELNAWLNTAGQLMAALAVGYPDQDPPARPRIPLAELVDWRD